MRRAAIVLCMACACVPSPPEGGPGVLDVPDAAVADAAAPDVAGAIDAGDLSDAGGDPDLGAIEDAALDAGDAAAPDAALAACAAAGGECAAPGDCDPAQSPPSNCETCLPYFREPCVAAACTTPAAADVHEISFTVQGGVPVLTSLVWMAVAADTPAGVPLTCAEIYAGTAELANTCYNVLEVRYREIVQPGDTYAVLTGGFASGLSTLFIVYGHEQQRGRGVPAGVSCTEYQVAAPTGAVVRFEGDDMRVR